MFIWKLSAVWKYVECFHAHYLFDKNNKTKKYWTTYHTLLFVMLVMSERLVVFWCLMANLHLGICYSDFEARMLIKNKLPYFFLDQNAFKECYCFLKP